MGKANSGMCVGIGKISKIKAAKPTGAKLLPSPPHGLSALEGRRLLAHNFRTYCLAPRDCLRLRPLCLGF
jgi:hypothetical protein